MKKLVFAWASFVFGFFVFWVINITEHDVAMLPIAISMNILAICLAAECEYVERITEIQRAESRIVEIVNRKLLEYPIEFSIKHRKI